MPVIGPSRLRFDEVVWRKGRIEGLTDVLLAKAEQAPGNNDPRGRLLACRHIGGGIVEPDGLLDLQWMFAVIFPGRI